MLIFSLLTKNPWLKVQKIKMIQHGSFVYRKIHQILKKKKIDATIVL